MRPSQGRRSTVREVLAMVQASSADIPTTFTAKNVVPWPPRNLVTSAARYR